ncbi:ubiquitin carboxyl-terminal hydrolase 37-like protein [Lates japonicus]|uniref:Ubiquitin carboxyl-terminal hydrolase 37-like protein n=1 Tax=Lates japonicus TaxID=270547 RepID=A0AAD3M9S1_LATJO|nr:ubiquitin carboxyl-terminal hydrolase 37-like protein [Lates japonicus]
MAVHTIRRSPTQWVCGRKYLTTQQSCLPQSAQKGFPNLEQICYMSSALHSLLTLSHFVQEFNNQEKVWSSHPDSQLIRRSTSCTLTQMLSLFGFSINSYRCMQVGVRCFSNNKAEKNSVQAALYMPTSPPTC